MPSKPPNWSYLFIYSIIFNPFRGSNHFEPHHVQPTSARPSRVVVSWPPSSCRCSIASCVMGVPPGASPAKALENGLVGGFDPSEKYARQIGNLPQFSGWTWKIFGTSFPFWARPIFRGYLSFRQVIDLTNPNKSLSLQCHQMSVQMFVRPSCSWTGCRVFCVGPAADAYILTDQEHLAISGTEPADIKGLFSGFWWREWPNISLSSLVAISSLKGEKNPKSQAFDDWIIHMSRALCGESISGSYLQDSLSV